MKDLCIREVYTNAKGEEQVSWNKIGVLIDSKNGKQYVKLNHIPGVLISVFEQKERNTNAPAKPKVDEINLDEAVPF
jgi:hypothetical protein